MFNTQEPANARLDMTIARSAFMRQLAGAFPGLRQPETDVFCGDHLGCQWSIRLQPAPPTRLGSVVLERWLMDVTLQAPSRALRGLWWQRFSAHFQRGGG